MVTKTQAAAGGGLTVLGAGGTAVGVVLSDSGYDKEKDKMPNYDFTILAWETDYDSVYGNSKDTEQTVGKKYAWYLTGTYGFEYKDEKKQLDLKDNSNWWEWAFNRWMIDTYEGEKNKTGEFSVSKVKSSYSPRGSEDNSALNRVCESIYKKKVSDLTDEANLLRYCSPMSGKPIVIKDSKTSYNSGTYGDTKKETLVSVNDDLWNNMFFILKDNEFFGKVNGEGEGKSLTVKDKRFYELYEKKGDQIRENVYSVCSETYSLNDSSSNVEEDALIRYCSWNV